MSKGVSPKVFRDWKVPACEHPDREFAVDVLNGYDVWSYKGCWEFYRLVLVNCRRCCATEKEALELAFRMVM